MNAARGFDYLVIGGGSAGCVLAARLSEDPTARVCLLEAGARARHPAVAAPMLNFITSAVPRYQWGWWTEPDAGLGGRRLSFPQARVLGGGSTINGMLHAPGDADDYAAWGARGWSFDEVAPAARRVAETLEVSRGGPLLPLCEMFLQAAESVGHPRLATLTGRSSDGVGYFDYAIARGRRRGSQEAYLRPARSRPNLTVTTGAQALRVLIEHGRAVGVRILQGGAEREIRADAEVILCAGGLGSARLLMLSGVGPADGLLGVGLPTVVESPEVGQNLQNHLRVKLGYATRDTATALSLTSPGRAIASALAYATGRHGVLGRSILTAGGLTRSRSALDQPDTGIIFSPGLMGAGSGPLGALPREAGFSVFVRQARPFSRGELRLRSADPLAPPVIDTRYFSDPRDLDVLAAGLECARQICAQPELARVIARALPGPITRQDIAESAGHAFHPVGACRMGEDAGSVVDPQLRVRGVEGLRVADSSVIPTIPKSGTNAPAMIVAERAAELISGMHSRY